MPGALARACIARCDTFVDDTQVNAADSTTDVNNNNTTQSETSLAINGNVICAGFNDSGTGSNTN